MPQTHTHALMFIFGLCCTIVVQTLGRVSFDGLSHAPLFRSCGMLMLLEFTNVFVVLWMWRIVFPREFRMVKMKWQVLLCFVPLVLPTIMRGVHSPISVGDELNGSASIAFQTWRAVLQTVLVLVLWMLVPLLYYISVRTNRHVRFSKKITLFIIISIVGSITYALTFFGDQTSVSVFIALFVLYWVVVLRLERRNLSSHKKDFSSVALLCVMVIAVPAAFGVAVTIIFDGLDENSSLQLLVCLFRLRVN